MVCRQLLFLLVETELGNEMIVIKQRMR